MKKNINIIEIRGMRGLAIALGVGCCLIAGFGVFPGWVGMNLWNFISQYINGLPAIGLIQGILLWGIIVASYFTFRKNKLVVCFRTPQGLSDEELKSVFADIKKQNDPIIQAMMKAREAELKNQIIKDVHEAKEENEHIQNS